MRHHFLLSDYTTANIIVYKEDNELVTLQENSLCSLYCLFWMESLPYYNGMMCMKNALCACFIHFNSNTFANISPTDFSKFFV
jgi:hypothetical protein